jgi:hypothetical protein
MQKYRSLRYECTLLAILIIAILLCGILVRVVIRPPPPHPHIEKNHNQFAGEDHLNIGILKILWLILRPGCSKKCCHYLGVRLSWR